MLTRVTASAMRALLLGVCLAGAACDPGQIVTTSTRPSGDGIRQTTLTVHVSITAPDSGLAELLDWKAGVPNAEVRLLRNGTAEWRSVRTNDSGAGQFDALGGGQYRLYGGRVLSVQEAERVGGALRAFGDGRTLWVNGDTTIELHLSPDRAGTVVISEIGSGSPVPWETGGTGYGDGMYFEVYHNGDGPVYLDGTLFGVAFQFGYNQTAHTACSVSVQARGDSLGIHTRAIMAFPGGGTDHLLAPGESRVVAIAAIDHRPVHPTLLDLSHAAFEIGGAASANNPAVPDMVQVGLERFVDNHLLYGNDVYFLASATDVRALPSLYRDTQGRQYLRVPRERLLDVAAFAIIWPSSNLEYPPCGLMVHREFNRYEGGFVEIGFDADHAFNTVRGLQRRALRLGQDGRVVLFNTKTSAVDFEHALRTPGWVREP